MAMAQAAASRAGSRPWLVMTGSNTAFDPVSAKWYAISVKKVFGFDLGTWKYDNQQQECGFKPGPAERRLQRKAEAEERQKKYQAQQAQRGEAEAEDEDEEEEDDNEDEEDEDEEDEKEAWDYESSDDEGLESLDDDWQTLMDLTWAQDGPFFCCMDCCSTDEDTGYESDDDPPRGRVLVFNALDGSCKRIAEFDKQLALPVGVGVQAKPDGNYRIVVVTGAYNDDAVSMSVWDSSSGNISRRDGGSCSFKKVEKHYSSNFILDSCFYFLLEYTGGFSALYFDLASNRWSYWATGLTKDFFSKVSVKPNLLKSQDRLLALGGLPGQGLVIVELSKPQREETLNRYSHPSYLHRSFVDVPTKDRPHRAGTYKVVASLPRKMWKKFRKSSGARVRAFSNDEFVYVLPDRKLKAGDKGVLYATSSGTWEWTAPFPDKCEEGGELHWTQMLGCSSIVVNHREDSLWGDYDASASTIYPDDWYDASDGYF